MVDKLELYNIIWNDIYKSNLSKPTIENFNYQCQTNKKNCWEDFVSFSKQYFDSAILCHKFILANYKDNNLIDSIGLCMIYLYRHSLELIIKSIILKKYNFKNAIGIINEHKHSLSSLLNYILSEVNCDLHDNLIKYMRELDEFDHTGDLFRYPFKYEFLDKYRNKSINIFEMSMCFIYIYSLLYEKIANKSLDSINAVNLQYFKSILEKNNWNFFVEAESGHNNCYLWQLHTKNDCYKQIKGFRWVSKLLYYESTLNDVKDIRLPMLYSYRHLVELSMKDYGYVRSDIMVEKIGFYNCKDFKNVFFISHDLNKKIFNYIKAILDYELQDEECDEEIKKFKENLDYISMIDSKSELFRYPVNKSGENFLRDEINVELFCKKCDECYSFIELCKEKKEYISDNLYEMYSDY